MILVPPWATPPPPLPPLLLHTLKTPLQDIPPVVPVHPLLILLLILQTTPLTLLTLLQTLATSLLRSPPKRTLSPPTRSRNQNIVPRGLIPLYEQRKSPLNCPTWRSHSLRALRPLTLSPTLLLPINILMARIRDVPLSLLLPLQSPPDLVVIRRLRTPLLHLFATPMPTM